MTATTENPNHADWCLTHWAQVFGHKCVLAGHGKDCEIVVARVIPIVGEEDS